MSFHVEFSIVLSIFALANIVNAGISIINSEGHTVDTFGCFPSSFSVGLEDTLMGLIVLANPPTACDSIQQPHFFQNDTISRFVLINGSQDCLSLTKAKNAESANFDLALIYGNNLWPPGIPFKNFDFSKAEVGIPIMFLTHFDGVRIRQKYLYDNRSTETYILKITSPTDDISYYIMLFSVVIGVCLFVMVLFMICLLVKCIQERRRSRRNRLSTWQIRQIPTEIYKKGDQYDVCAICLEDYFEGDKLRILPCSHAYHSRCVDPWLTDNRRNCPLCKRKIRLGDSVSDSDSDSELTSPAEDTPLLGSVSERGPTWGTFGQVVNNSSSSDDGPARGLAASSSQSGQYNVAADVEPSEFEKSEIMVSAEGSINCADMESSVEYLSCNIPQEAHSTAGENNHGVVV